MSSDFFVSRAVEDFNRARGREMFGRILSLLKNEKDNLLSLQEVKALLKPTSETYRGLCTVPVEKIVGSEGRYQDFNKYFLPRHNRLKGRWIRVDTAHHQQLTLPPVTLYEIGGVYFVRDGNHRVSVGKLQGVEFIDAEVISLGSRLSLKPGMTKEQLRTAVIKLEREEFFKHTRLDHLRPGLSMNFTATGRYDEIIRHINGHKYFINLSQKEEISFEQAMLSWYDTVYRPIVDLIEEQRFLKAFPGRTAADLYVWIVRHWDELKKKYGQAFPLKRAAQDYTERFGRPDKRPRRLLAGVSRFLKSLMSLGKR
ncbi:MAG: transcriptional regulator [Spirochaetaceae bacterium]|nr:MAG: transcriptional regulator [Spirochaetaceae bacterium]